MRPIAVVKLNEVAKGEKTMKMILDVLTKGGIDGLKGYWPMKRIFVTNCSRSRMDV